MRKLVIMVTAAVLILLDRDHRLFTLDVGRHGDRSQETWAVRGGDARQGRQPIDPLRLRRLPRDRTGSRAPTGRVGPKLQDIHEQIYIAGMVDQHGRKHRHLDYVSPKCTTRGRPCPTWMLRNRMRGDMAAYLYENP
jgi:hypothetical protein